jgi:superfamily II DNA/RNA helicase
MLSATLSDTPESFHIFGYMLGLYKSLSQARNWVQGMIRDDKSYIGAQPKLSSINNHIYPDKGSRIRISELGEKFPSNQISADSYFIEEIERKRINEAFATITKDATHIKSNLADNSNANILKEITKARQLIEKIKIPIIENMANEYIENGYNVVIFVNYNASIRELAKRFKTESIVNGEESVADRMANIEKFQNNETNIILCSNGAGGLGISLHDLHGKPRVSIISPSFSSQELVQSLGRIYRAGSQTPALQRIIYCANTCEEIICNRLKEKLNFLSKLNDNDLVQFDE